MKKALISTIIVGIIIFIIYATIIENYEEKKELNNVNYDAIYSQNMNSNIQYSTTNNDNKTEEIEIEKILPDKYKSFNVIAKLEIPKINLESYVLEECNNKTLSTSTVKFWGCEPNEIGNFCIAGHNYRKKSMFKDLRKLAKGDEITLTDTKNRIVKYEVYEKKMVTPQNTNDLSQNTNGKKEITLITCTNDSKSRIIIKCKEYEL